MRLAAYLRVSTDKQADEGLGLAVQRRAIRQWARSHRHRITGEYVDEGVSGDCDLDHRPQLAAAFRELEADRADALVVYRLDRLARKLALQLTWIEHIEGQGRHVISVSEPDIGEDELRDLIRNVLGAISQYERQVIKRRMANGRAEKHRRGGYAYGAPPFGWTTDNGHPPQLVPEPAEQRTIARMRELRAEGHSTPAIARQLTAEGYPPKRGTGQWHARTVSRVLARDAALKR